MPNPNEFVGWAAVVYIAIQVMPKLAAIFTRRHSTHDQVQHQRIQQIFDEHDRLLKDCRSVCEKMEDELDDKDKEIEHERKRRQDAERRCAELEGILYRMGWQEQRHTERKE